MSIVQWPELDELAKVLDVTDDSWRGEDYDASGPTRLERLRLAAIAQVKLDVGHWDEYEDEPDESLSQAALRLAELMALRPEATPVARLTLDPTYQRLLFGHRRSFGIG